ncbi:hypothetical protein RUND412_001780 [Rhizina undulata]
MTPKNGKKPKWSALREKKPKSPTKNESRVIPPWAPMNHACVAYGCTKIVGGHGFVKSCLEPHGGSNPHLEFCPRRHQTAMAFGESQHCKACLKEDTMMNVRLREIEDMKASLAEQEAEEIKNPSDIRKLRAKLETLKKVCEEARRSTEAANEERRLGYELWMSKQK